MNRKQKQIVINSVLHTIEKSFGLFVIDFKGVNAFALTAFKKKLFKANSKVSVVKNSLLSIAAKTDTNLEQIASNFEGQIALVYAFEDPFNTASVVDDFLKNAKDINFKVGLIQNNKINSSAFEKISKIKSYKDLQAQLCGMLKGPIVNLIGTLMQISKK
jgi:large subunit ribosomal protein L10